MDEITIGSVHIPVDLVVFVVSSLASWLVTRWKRKGKELPPIIAPYIGTIINYADLKAAYDHAEQLYSDPDVRRKAFAEKLRDIAMERTGVALPDFVVNYLAENAVAWAKSGWKMLGRAVAK
jgi:hypothetical protein